MGVINDSRFYTLQALGGIDPARYGADLFLAFGSQDSFTLFSSLYRPFLTAFGIGTGNLLLFLIGGGLWLIAAHRLALVWLGDRRRALAATAVTILLPGGIYFFYGEAFVTPRLFAESGTMLAIALALRGRLGIAALVLGAACVIHPLTTLPGILLIFLYESRRQPKLWWLAGAGAASTGALAIAGVDPFARLLRRFDPQWLAIVQGRDNHCFIANWGAYEWLQVANMLALAMLVLVRGGRGVRPLMVLAIAVAAGGMATAVVGADLLHNQLLTSIQTWRWIWLLALLTHMALAKLLFDGSRPRLELPFTIAAIVSLALSPYLVPTALLVTPFTIAALCAGTIEQRRTLRLVMLVPGAMLISGVVSACIGQLADTPALTGSVIEGVVMVGAIALAIAVQLQRPTQAAPLVAVALALLAISAARWDQRSPWRIFVDTTPAPPADLAALLPATGQVYWDGDMATLWFLARRPSYFSCEQGAGVLFSRGTAVAWRHRADSFERLRTIDFQRYSFCPMPDGGPRSVDGDALVQVCRREPGLGAIVLTRPLPGVSAAVWKSPVTFSTIVLTGETQHTVETDRFFIYRCANFR